MKKLTVDKLVKRALGTDDGKQLLLELYSVYSDRSLIGDSELETGRRIGQHELVQDLIRIVYGKSFISEEVYGRLDEDT